jgi:short subunit dehydrogenase-like uncharacterized protein
MKRDFDIALYGATGFVGQQTVAYFCQHYPKLRIALGGRDRRKLEAVALRYKLNPKNTVLVADAQDAKALAVLAQSASVVLSTAGPFTLYGSQLVAACVNAKTHYVDITGETPWVKKMIDAHHEQAANDGTRIVPCCGFDSVPSDIGAWLAATTMMHTYGEPCVDVKAAFSMRGGLNGGTLASIANILGSKESAKAARDVFLLNPADTRPSDETKHGDVLLPRSDSDFKAWIGPFIMAAINTRVVRRSAALSLLAEGESAPYDAQFRYQEYMRFGKGPVAGATAAAFSWGLGAGALGMRLSPIKALALKLGPGPGEGPSESAMDNGGFRCEYIARSASGKILHGKMSTKGDPGNRATTRFVCEAAVALVLDQKSLPGAGVLGGVLTPASAFAQVLVDRLSAKGTQITMQAPRP